MLLTGKLSLIETEISLDRAEEGLNWIENERHLKFTRTRSEAGEPLRGQAVTGNCTFIEQSQIGSSKNQR